VSTQTFGEHSLRPWQGTACFLDPRNGCAGWQRITRLVRPFLTASRLGFRQPEIARFRSRRVAAFQQVKGAPTALVARTQGPGRWNRRGAFVLQKRGRA
jgi:hypothetical protein